MNWAFALKALNLGALGRGLAVPSACLSMLSGRLSWERGSGQGWHLPQVETVCAALAHSPRWEPTRRLGPAPCAPVGVARWVHLIAPSNPPTGGWPALQPVSAPRPATAGQAGLCRRRAGALVQLCRPANH